MRDQFWRARRARCQQNPFRRFARMPQGICRGGPRAEHIAGQCRRRRRCRGFRGIQNDGIGGGSLRNAVELLARQIGSAEHHAPRDSVELEERYGACKLLMCGNQYRTALEFSKSAAEQGAPRQLSEVDGGVAAVKHAGGRSALLDDVLPERIHCHSSRVFTGRSYYETGSPTLWQTDAGYRPLADQVTCALRHRHKTKGRAYVPKGSQNPAK